jgi:hypothetical protein
MTTTEPASFFLTCGPDSDWFYAVEFYPTAEAMLQAIAKLRGKAPTKADRDARAVCLRYVAEGRNRKGRLVETRELGTLFFVRGDAPPEVVVHELTHAAIGWARRTKVDPMKRSDRYERCQEEKFTRTFQHMFEEFYQKAPRVLSAAA